MQFLINYYQNKIMRKISTLVTLFAVTSFGLFVTSNIVNADVIVPPLHPAPTKVYSVFDFVNQLYISDAMPSSDVKVTGYVIENDTLLPVDGCQGTATTCPQLTATEFLRISDTAYSTSTQDTLNIVYDHNRINPSSFIVGKKYVFSVYDEPTSRQIQIRSFTSTNSIISPTPTPNPNAIPKFTRVLRIGSSGIDVKNLQIFLNANGFVVAISGSGSSGHETTYFGPATSRALVRFQNQYAASILTPAGLTQGTGYFGPSTMAKVNQLIGN